MFFSQNFSRHAQVITTTQTIDSLKHEPLAPSYSLIVSYEQYCICEQYNIYPKYESSVLPCSWIVPYTPSMNYWLWYQLLQKHELNNYQYYGDWDFWRNINVVVNKCKKKKRHNNFTWLGLKLTFTSKHWKIILLTNENLQNWEKLSKLKTPIHSNPLSIPKIWRVKAFVSSSSVEEHFLEY